MNRKGISLAIFLLFVFMMPVAAQFNQSPTPIAPATPEAGARFGDELVTGDVNGDGLPDVIVGIPHADGGGRRDVGQVAIYFGGSNFGARVGATLQAPDPVDDAHFGAVLATGDVNGDGIDDILVGAPGATAGDQVDAGLVYIFHGDRTFDTSSDRTLQAPTPQADARFGVSIAVGDFNGGGADIVVGANLTDITTGQAPMQTTVRDAGQAYVFFGPGFDANTATLQATTPEAGARFGTAVAAANLNNDGFKDVVVAGDRTDVMAMTPQPNAGEAVVFFGAMPAQGSMTQLDTTLDLTLRGVTIQAGAGFGRMIVAGDVNGDGIEDVVISAPLFDTSATLRDVGEAYVFQGAANITGTPAANATIRGPLASFSYFGASLALGDVDGDGINDITAGAPGSEIAGQASAGRVFILLSGVQFTGVLSTSVALQAPIPQNGTAEANAEFGRAVAAADLDQDGLADVIVGAPGATVNNLSEAGRGYVFFSSAPTVPFVANP
ncbi:MAG: FG-GAP repeat protein [Acidobacteria bacterium]|nr:FG-GAP repeat protein [Acidobacteriota bacterium]